MKIPRINNQIRAEEVRLISEEGKNLGIFSFEKALQYARERHLDLIEVTKDGALPICRVADFGKYLYQQKKKEKLQRKKQKIAKIKGLRISLRISEHDLDTKANLAKRFFKEGHKVKVEVVLRGREKRFSELAKKKLEALFEKIKEEVEIKIEGEIKKSPRGLEIMIGKK